MFIIENVQEILLERDGFIERLEALAAARHPPYSMLVQSSYLSSLLSFYVPLALLANDHYPSLCSFIQASSLQYPSPHDEKRFDLPFVDYQCTNIYLDEMRAKILQNERINTLISKFNAANDDGFHKFFHEYLYKKFEKRKRGEGGQKGNIIDCYKYIQNACEDMGYPHTRAIP